MRIYESTINIAFHFNIKINNNIAISINDNSYTHPYLNNDYLLLLTFLKHYIKLSITDSLTGVYNKRYLTQLPPKTLHNCCICVIDIDNFKTINDKIGHVGGDSVLIDICNIINSELNHQDALIRFGGDEFIIIHKTNKIEHTKHTLKKIQKKISKNYLDKPIHPHISYGIAKHLKHSNIINTIQLADFLMYSFRKKRANTKLQ